MPKPKRPSKKPLIQTPRPEAPAIEEAFGDAFPIVGVGASAGGLAAFEAFLSGMPKDADPGMAFVLVQHLAPDHKSILTELVRRYTRMEVFEVHDGMAVRANCAYVIPPNRDMALINGTLQLFEPAAARGHRLPIDFFFRSLAADRRERAIGVILSGTGSDGTMGVRAVKGEGGMVMVQNPESTEYDGMPRSAIATGLVDLVLPPAEMAAHLVSYARRTKPRSLGAALPADDAAVLSKVFVLLRSQTGHDFSHYKPNTIRRRIERRMAVQEVEGLGSYLRYLQSNSAEVESLFRDLLIGVTSFFRDPEEFKVLESRILPGLFAGKPAGSTVRAWVPACSTGEEAYTIAILLQEQLDSLKKGYRVQVFATDIDRRAVDAARGGVYPANIAADMTPERLDRFFREEPKDGSFRVVKSLRDMLVFSEQDVLKDPPFSKLDLISCRNLLIYLGPELQKRLIPVFHYALNPKGALFLGNSESIGEHADLFAVAGRKTKLYLRKEPLLSTRLQPLARFAPPRPAGRAAPAQEGRGAGDGRPKLRELTERILLSHNAVVGALVDARGRILYLHGRSGRYLEPAPGEAASDILKMAREGLRQDLAAALRKAVTDKRAVRRPGLKVKTNGGFTIVDLTVQPVTDASADAASLYLVILEDAPEPEAAGRRGRRARPLPKPAAAARIDELERELRSKEEHLQSATEELETSNEELQSSSEEMQSVNEELQSTNEELETSKEELQSVNEELSTVNAELQTKVSDLSQINNDMANLLASTGIGMVFVDHQLRIQRFTPAATQVINLIAGDIGRPVGHIVSNLEGYGGLVDDLRLVLDTLVPKEVEVRGKAGAWYLLRIRPYRTVENVIEGAVVTFVDITELKNAQAALRDTEGLRRLAAVVRDAHDAVAMLGLDGGILAWNPGAQRLYGWTEAEALKKNLSDLVPEARRADELRELRQMTQSQASEPRRATRVAKDGRTFEVLLTATSLIDEAGKVYAVATTERAIAQG